MNIRTTNGIVPWRVAEFLPDENAQMALPGWPLAQGSEMAAGHSEASTLQMSATIQMMPPSNPRECRRMDPAGK